MAVLVSNVAARVRTQAVAAMARARTHRVALRLQPQARRRRHARRRAVGDRLPDRADAEGAGRAAAAGERLDRRARPAIRPRTRSTRPISRPPNGPGRTTGRPGAAPTRCRAPSACSCRCAPAAARSAWSASTATSRARCSRPDERRLLDALIDQGALAIERVHLVEDMDRVKRTVETDRLRSALLTSISHDLQDAARRRCSARPARCAISAASSPTRRRPICSRRSSTSPSGSTASSPICST